MLVSTVLSLLQTWGNTCWVISCIYMDVGEGLLGKGTNKQSEALWEPSGQTNLPYCVTAMSSVFSSLCILLCISIQEIKCFSSKKPLHIFEHCRESCKSPSVSSAWLSLFSWVTASDFTERCICSFFGETHGPQSGGFSQSLWPVN